MKNKKMKRRNLFLQFWLEWKKKKQIKKITDINTYIGTVSNTKELVSPSKQYP